MSESQFELSVGDSVRVDDQILTVLDINGDEITFRVDLADEHEASSASSAEAIGKRLRPR